jgi:hypothetical protein
MLPTGIRRIVMFSGHVDFRKQCNGLLAEARRLGFEPYDGQMLVFVRRDKRQLRAIVGDDIGLYLLTRRFEGGCLKFDFDKRLKDLTQAELLMWLEGAHFSVHKTAKPWR